MRSSTKHHYTIIVRAAYDDYATDADATTYDFIVGGENRILEYNRVEWTTKNIPKGIDSIITRLEDGVGGGCIWNSDVMIVDNDNPHIKKEFERYGGLKGYFELCCYKKEATRVLKTYPVPAFSTAVITASQLIDKKHCLNLLERNKTERDELKQKRVGPNSLFMHQNESIVDWEKRLKFMFPEETKEIDDIMKRIKILGSKSKITTPKSNHDTSESVAVTSPMKLFRIEISEEPIYYENFEISIIVKAENINLAYMKFWEDIINDKDIDFSDAEADPLFEDDHFSNWVIDSYDDKHITYKRPDKLFKIRVEELDLSKGYALAGDWST